MNRRFAAALTVACFAAAVAHAQSAPTLAQAIDKGDPQSLEEAMAAKLPGPEERLAKGLVAAALNRDAEAEALLAAAAADRKLDAGLRREAAATLSGVRLRVGDFAGAAAMLDAAAAIEPLDADEQQTRAFAAPLAGAPRIRRGALKAGAVALTRDMADLARAVATINGGEQEAVLDTGAAFSTIVQSRAESLGLRFFDGAVSVGAAALQDLPARVAVADSLTFGGVEFRNVVFIVVPDEALSFADGQYTIEAIIGFPVLSRLERLTFEARGEMEQLRFAPSKSAARAGNLYLDGLVPIVLADIEGADRKLRMMLDTGAHVTNLSRRAVLDNPSLAAKAETKSASFGGAGGGTSEEDAFSLPSLILRVGGATVTLNDVPALAGGEAGRRDGLLGQDVLRSGSGYVLDFGAMTLEILASSPESQ